MDDNMAGRDDDNGDVSEQRDTQMTFKQRKNNAKSRGEEDGEV